MHRLINESFNIVIGLVITAVIISICVVFTSQAKQINIRENNMKALYSEMREMREWRKYEGAVSGADLIDFISRNKDICDIVIIDSELSLNINTNSFLISGKLIMGISDTRNIPDIFWDTTFIYDNIINGKGNWEYRATLLYDGQLTPEYENGRQIIGGTVTGIEFEIV